MPLHASYSIQTNLIYLLTKEISKQLIHVPRRRHTLVQYTQHLFLNRRSDPIENRIIPVPSHSNAIGLSPTLRICAPTVVARREAEFVQGVIGDGGLVG